VRALRKRKEKRKKLISRLEPITKKRECKKKRGGGRRLSLEVISAVCTMFF
jgi:hypothetical protein